MMSSNADVVVPWLEARLEKWWVPDAIEFVEARPIGATGKILTRTLREQFAGYRFSTE